MYKCGDATSISKGKREESILIESNIEKVIYDLVNASQTYELVETKRLIRADTESPAIKGQRPVGSVKSPSDK